MQTKHVEVSRVDFQSYIVAQQEFENAGRLGCNVLGLSFLEENQQYTAGYTTVRSQKKATET